MKRSTKLALGLTLSVLASTLALPAYAGYVKFDLPNSSDSNTPQSFYCTATTTDNEANPTVSMFSHAQLITGFLNAKDPDNTGRLDLTALDLNKYYFNAIQDPKNLSEAGYVLVAATGSDIQCQLGDGGRTLHPGAYGVKHVTKK